MPLTFRVFTGQKFPNFSSTPPKTIDLCFFFKKRGKRAKHKLRVLCITPKPCRELGQFFISLLFDFCVRFVVVIIGRFYF